MCGPGNYLRHSHNHQENTAVPVEKVPPKQATKTCPRCRTQVQEEFVFCPSCGAELLAACPECHRAVETGWTHCANCGADLVVE
jgi:RNA polymerase subunit RPABC4/transcription elongation factor Spt4